MLKQYRSTLDLKLPNGIRSWKTLCRSH